MNNKLADMTVDKFTNELASSAPVPGGGGVSALVGAFSVALASMVGNLTTGKKKYAATEEELLAIMDKLPSIMNKMLEAMDKDAEVFYPLSQAYSLPRSTEEEIKKRNEILEKLLKDAALAPLNLMEDIYKSLSLLDRLSIIGSDMVISDIGVGASLAKAAIESAAFNVYINTKLMRDRGIAKEYNIRATDLVSKASSLADKIIKCVLDKVK